LGENESGVSKAIGVLVPTLLSGILNKSSDSNAVGNIFSALAGFNPDILDKLGSLIGGGNLAHNDPKDTAGHFLGSLFGAKVPAITNAVSSFAGIKPSSTSSLLGLAGPLVMGFLSKKISSGGLNVSGLLNLLNSEKSSIMGALPAGLGAVLGLANMSNASVNTTVSSDDRSSGGVGWLWPLLLLLGLGGGIMYFLKNGNGKPAEMKKDEMVNAPVNVAPAAPEPKVKLDAGTEEAAMQVFIMSNDTIDKKKWFNFPEIQFDVNKSNIKPESEVKLNNVLASLNAYPAVKVRIGGYTDSDGDDKKNMKLSDDRAKAVMGWLANKGVAADRMEAEGYGEQHPVAPNDSPVNKAKNRRISFSVRTK
jgi:outer membrane protein OmpA-like peptidoglycan-associated protein